MKKFLSLTLVVVLLFSLNPTAVFASEESVDEYYDIINNSEQISSEYELSDDFNAESGTVLGAGSRNFRAYNVGVVTDHIGFNASYVLSQKIRGYARTKVTGLNIFDPVPDWTVYAGGNLYKNGRHLYGAPTTSQYGGAGDVRSDSPYDYYPESGDEYYFTSYHTVKDYYGKVVWNTTHYRTKTY